MAMGKLVRPTELVMPSEAKAAGFPGNNSPGKKKKRKSRFQSRKGSGKLEKPTNMSIAEEHGEP